MIVPQKTVISSAHKFIYYILTSEEIGLKEVEIEKKLS
jgi:hypothetical protein